MGSIRKSAKRRMIEHNDYVYRRAKLQESVANDIRHAEKDATRQRNDINTFHLGEKWFDCGLPLEDAPENFKNDINFIKGFERAQRIQKIALQQYEMGVEFCKNGLTIDQIPDMYRDKPDIIKGYNDTLNNSKKK